MTKPHKSISTVGTCCPMPLIRLSDAVNEMQPGMLLSVTGDDPIFEVGVRDFCEARGYEVLDVTEVDSSITITVRI